MADIALANSTYSTGTNDTASTLINNVTATDAQQYNGVASAAVGIETILGTGTTLKGNKADLVARLAVGIDADGLLKLSTDAAITGPLSVAKGGTGTTTNTTPPGVMYPYAVSSAPSGFLLCDGSAVSRATYAALFAVIGTTFGVGDGSTTFNLPNGLQDPLSDLTVMATGTGSTVAHEGTVTIAANQALSGIHFYTNFTLNAGVTITPAAASNALIIYATDTITINGTIAANGKGPAGGAGSNTTPSTPGAGGHGTDQPGGNGGSPGGGSGSGAGGDVYLHSSLVAGSGQVSGSSVLGAALPLALGGAGGGGGGGTAGTAGGAGGAGGASIILVAPTVVLGAAAVLNTSGANGGSVGIGGGNGGGGGAGNVYIFTNSYTDSGATFTQTAGAAGSGGGSAGGAGAAGVKQINLLNKTTGTVARYYIIKT